MDDILAVIMQLSVFVFVITSMLAMGLNLTVAQIIDPNVTVMILVAALLGLVVLMVIGGELGKHVSEAPIKGQSA